MPVAMKNLSRNVSPHWKSTAVMIVSELWPIKLDKMTLSTLDRWKFVAYLLHAIQLAIFAISWRLHPGKSLSLQVCWINCDDCAISKSNVHVQGDTLFLGGCGRFFEGTAQQMYTALIEKLSSLPDDTLVYCGHEYTLQNLAFAKHVEPKNEFIGKKIQWSQEQRAKNQPTVNPPFLYTAQVYSTLRNIFSGSFNDFWRETNQSFHESKRTGCAITCRTFWWSWHDGVYS